MYLAEKHSMAAHVALLCVRAGIKEESEENHARCREKIHCENHRVRERKATEPAEARRILYASSKSRQRFLGLVMNQLRSRLPDEVRDIPHIRLRKQFSSPAL